MFAMFRGAGRDPAAGRSCQLALDRNSDALRGDPAADPGAHRHDGQHRPPPQVRRRRLPPRARRPVGHPHRRGAAHLARPRRDPRRGRSADAAHGLHAVLPPRGRLGRARHPRACCACTSSTRSSSSPTRRPSRRRTCTPRSSSGPSGSIARPRARLPRPRPLHRRPRQLGGAHVRHRGLRARLSTSGSRCRRCRGSATTRPGGPTSATGRRRAEGTAGGAHAQRLGARRAPRVGRARRDPSPARRHRSRSPKCCGRTCGGPRKSPARVPAVTTAQWIFAIALALVTVLITWLSVYVAWTTVWANRWYRRRG